MRPFSDTPLDRWLVEMAHGIRNRLGMFAQLEVKMGSRIGVFEKLPRGWRQCWGGACIAGTTRWPVILLNAQVLGLTPEAPPTDEAIIRRTRNVMIHECMHAVVGMRSTERAHGKEFRARCAKAARVFCLPPPGPRVPASSWPAIRSLKKPKPRKRRRHAA